jgi:hypothetical protein
MVCLAVSNCGANEGSRALRRRRQKSVKAAAGNGVVTQQYWHQDMLYRIIGCVVDQNSRDYEEDDCA